MPFLKPDRCRQWQAFWGVLLITTAMSLIATSYVKADDVVGVRAGSGDGAREGRGAQSSRNVLGTPATMKFTVRQRLRSQGDIHRQRASTSKEPPSVAIATICSVVDKDVGSGTGNGGLRVGPWRNITMENHAAYAAAQGYTYLPLLQPIGWLNDIKDNSKREAAGTLLSVPQGLPLYLENIRWHKSFYVRALLRKYDWVFWTDCDTLFLDFAQPMPIPGTSSADIPVHDPAGDGPHFIFNGDHNNLCEWRHPC